MEIRVFKEEDINQINQWMADRGEGALSFDVLSKTGFIAHDVACGFLYTTDSSIGFLDFYISNPKAPHDERSKSLDEITKCLIWAAKSKNIKLLVGASSHRGIQERCERFKFTHHGSQEVYTLEISK